MSIQPKRNSNCAGFTVTELLIVLGLIPFIAIAIAMMLSLPPRKFAEVEQDTLMTEQIRTALGYIGKDIRTADSIIAKAGQYSTDQTGTLIIAPDAGENRRIVWTTKNKSLERIVFEDAEAKKKVNQMKFSVPEADLMLNFDNAPPDTSQIQVSIKLTRKVMNKNRSIDFNEHFELRGQSK